LPFGQAGGGDEIDGARDGSSAFADLFGRPDGAAPMTLAWIALGLSILTGLIAWSASDDLDSGLAMAALMSSVSWAFFSMFLVLWPTGYIVRAISFLPGKEKAGLVSSGGPSNTDPNAAPSHLSP
jgi:hypothetical protein